MTGYRTAEVAASHGVSVATVRRWADRGLIESWQTPTGHYRFPASALARWTITDAGERALTGATS